MPMFLVGTATKGTHAALRWVASEQHGAPIGLISHSMGATVVLVPEPDSMNATAGIVAVATLAGVSKHISAATDPALE